MKKKNIKRIFYLLLIAGLLFILSSCYEYEASWYGEHYGIVTIKNQTSYDITRIRILEYSDGSGERIQDSKVLAPNASRTYKNEAVLNIEFSIGSASTDLRRYVRVDCNGKENAKTIYLSEGYNVELVLTDSGLVLTNPIYDPSK